MFEKQKAFFHSLRALVRNPLLLEQQSKNLECLTQDIENAEQKGEYHVSLAAHSESLLDHAQEAILERLNALSHAAMERMPAQQVYEQLKPWDKEQFSLFFAAKEILGIDPSDYFHTEDAMGCFENADGAKLLQYAEIAKFAEKEWRPLNGPGAYEVLDTYELRTDTQEYRQYRERLWPLAVEKVLERFKRALLQGTGLSEVLKVMDALDKAIRESPQLVEAEDIHLQGLFREAAIYCDPREVYRAIQPMDPQGEVLFRCVEDRLGDEAVFDLCRQVVNDSGRGEPGFLKTQESMRAAQDRVRRIPQMQPVAVQVQQEDELEL